MGIYSNLNSLNAVDRDNLADIAWFIKGMIAVGNNTFCDDHLKSLEHVISGIKNKINDEARNTKRPDN